MEEIDYQIQDILSEIEFMQVINGFYNVLTLGEREFFDSLCGFHGRNMINIEDFLKDLNYIVDMKKINQYIKNKFINYCRNNRLFIEDECPILTLHIYPEKKVDRNTHIIPHDVNVEELLRRLDEVDKTIFRCYYQYKCNCPIERLLDITGYSSMYFIDQRIALILSKHFTSSKEYPRIIPTKMDIVIQKLFSSNMIYQCNELELLVYRHYTGFHSPILSIANSAELLNIEKSDVEKILRILFTKIKVSNYNIYDALYYKNEIFQLYDINIKKFPMIRLEIIKKYHISPVALDLILKLRDQKLIYTDECYNI